MEDLPVTEQASLQRAVFTAMHAVEPLTDAEAALPVNEGASHFTTHPGQNINARFLKDGGVTFASGQPGKTWRGTLRFVSSEGSAWQADATRAERPAGPALTEWYENRAEGLEHGFTLAARPAAARETGFSLDMALDGLFAATDPDRAGDLVFIDPATDQAVLAYRDLKVWDATGRELAAVMRATGRGLRFTIRDEEAVYPVTIDPLIVSLEEKMGPGYRKVTAGDPIAEGRFGDAVALAGDIALIGAPGNDAPGANGAGAVYVFVRSGDFWQFQQKLTASGAAAGDAFGSRIALDGNTAAISAPGDDAGGNDAGAVYLFERSGSSWTQGTKLVASNAAAGDAFGESVALSGGDLLVGAPGKNADSGAAYLFIRNGATWGEHATFSDQSRFGAGVAMGDGVGMIINRYRVTTIVRSGLSWSVEEILYPNNQLHTIPIRSITMKGDTALVGMPEHPDAGIPNVGAAYVLRHYPSITRVRAKLMAPVAQENDFFGSSVAFDGAHALIGTEAFLGGGFANGTRAAYYFTGSDTSWALERTYHTPTGDPDDGFCHDLDVDGDFVVISAHQDGGEAVHMGSAYFYKTLYTAPGDHFGMHVDLDGDVAVAGAVDHDTSGAVDSGAAWVLRRYGAVWATEQKLTNDSPGAGDRFGVAVSISGDRIAVGADSDDEGGKTDCGSATIFERDAGGSWVPRNKLGTEVAAAGDNFGRSVAIDGDTVAVGAPLKLGARGRVWMYALGAGSSVQTQEITPAGAPGQARFGFSVALSGDRLIVGAPRWDIGGGLRTGRVFFYKREAGNWTADGAAGPSGAGATDYRAGISVALDGQVAVVGCGGPASWTGGGTPQPGRAFVLEHDGTSWGTTPVWLDNTDLDDGSSWFGMSVAMENDVLAAGASRSLSRPGRVRLFRKEGASWVMQQDVSAPESDDLAGNGFGYSIALSGETLLVGAYGASVGGEADRGLAYLYRITDPDAVLPALTITRSGSNVVLDWPSGTGLALWRSPTMTGGSWEKIAGSENVSTHSMPVSAAPRMFFRLGPP